MDTPGQGLVCIGCPGPVEGWITGINRDMVERGVTDSPSIFTEVIRCDCRPYNCSEDLTVLVFMFPKTTDNFDIGMLSALRLSRGGWMKWLSDFQDYHNWSCEK